MSDNEAYIKVYWICQHTYSSSVTVTDPAQPIVPHGRGEKHQKKSAAESSSVSTNRL